jgi:hypothetical protein
LNTQRGYRPSATMPPDRPYRPLAKPIWPDFYGDALRRFGGSAGCELSDQWRLSRPRMLWSQFVATLDACDRQLCERCVALAVDSE